MRTVICPKCHQVVTVPDNQDYVICCNEIIYAPFEIRGNDSEIFFNELENPSEPNDALKNAALLYKESTDETHDRETPEQN